MNPISRIIPLLLTAATLAHSQDVATLIPSGRVEASIPDEISDGIPSTSPRQRESLKFEVVTSNTQRVHVVQSPEMEGLPAPEGSINVTVQLVKDPGLPEPPLPLPALQSNDPAVVDRMTELRETYYETQLVFVSATVYDHKWTYLRCYPSGGSDRKEIALWSNLDFNHFSGFSTFECKGQDGVMREYGLVMGIGNEVTQQQPDPQAKKDEGNVVQEIPKLPDLVTGGPAFVITEGDTKDLEAMEFIEGMHNLYRVEGRRMEAAYLARTKAYEERKAFLLANPPKPKDVTIRFWKRNEPSARGLRAIGEVQP